MCLFIFVATPGPVCVSRGHLGGRLPLCNPPPPTLQAKNERNYHIFYELLAGLPAQLRQTFSLQEAETYYYLNQVSTSRDLRVSSPGPLPHHPSRLREPSHGVLMAAKAMEVWEGKLGFEVSHHGKQTKLGQGRPA